MDNNAFITQVPSFQSSIVPESNILTSDPNTLDMAILLAVDENSIINQLISPIIIASHFDQFSPLVESDRAISSLSYDSTIRFSTGGSVPDSHINLATSIYNPISIDNNLVITNTIDSESTFREIIRQKSQKLRAGTMVGAEDWITRYVSVHFIGSNAYLPDDPIPFFYTFTLTDSHMGVLDGGIATYTASPNDPSGVVYDGNELFYIANDLKVYDENGDLLVNGQDYIAIITDILGSGATIIDNAFEITLYFNKLPDSVWSVQYDRCVVSATGIDQYTAGYREYVISTPVELDNRIYSKATENGKPLYISYYNDIRITKNQPMNPSDPWLIKLHRGNITQIIKFDRMINHIGGEINYDQSIYYNALAYRDIIINISDELSGSLLPKIIRGLSDGGFNVVNGFIYKNGIRQTIKLAANYRINSAEQDIANNGSIIFESIDQARVISDTKIMVPNTPLYMNGVVTDGLISDSLIVTIGSEKFTPSNSDIKVDALNGIIDLGRDIRSRVKSNSVYVQYNYIKDYHLFDGYTDQNGLYHLVDFNPSAGHYMTISSAIESMSRLDSGLFYTTCANITFNNEDRDYPFSIGDYDVGNDLDTILMDGESSITGNTATYPRITTTQYTTTQLLDFTAQYMPSYKLLSKTTHIYLLPTTVDLWLPDEAGFHNIIHLTSTGLSDNVRISYDDNMFNPDSPSFSPMAMRVAIASLVSNNRMTLLDSRSRGGEVVNPFFDRSVDDYIVPGTVVITLPNSVRHSILSGQYTQENLSEAISNYMRAGFSHIIRYEEGSPLQLQINGYLCGTTNNTLSGISPLCVEFSAEYEGIEPVQIIWNFGDGSTSSTQNPSHTYTNYGDRPVVYNATCSIIDATGNIVSKYISPIIIGTPMIVEIEGEVID